ncbi:hypothetical protein L484_016750 [Morus notabilis]|uniref:Uncharacterized protein n=1 Tax=Morus notabilis TaxID=981085 RepID=W9RI07_9ROSA|nr:uncharacterized protein LOC21399786 [Morus notabilis]EXB55383.1 hypothetical protein L484_016750 [Morus notabilis]
MATQNNGTSMSFVFKVAIMISVSLLSKAVLADHQSNDTSLLQTKRPVTPMKVSFLSTLGRRRKPSPPPPPITFHHRNWRGRWPRLPPPPVSFEQPPPPPFSPPPPPPPPTITNYVMSPPPPPPTITSYVMTPPPPPISEMRG